MVMASRGMRVVNGVRYRPEDAPKDAGQVRTRSVVAENKARTPKRRSAPRATQSRKTGADPESK